MKLLVTGGHLTPALSFIDFLLTQNPQPEIVFVGREFSQVQSQQPSQEPVELEKRGLPFIPLESGRWQFHALSDFWREPSLLMKAYFHARRILKQEQPDAVVTFGGHLGVPVAYAAAHLRIPVVLHEQTHVVGMASRMITKVATKVALSRDLVNYQLPSNKSVFTGNLLRQIFFASNISQPSWLKYDLDVPILYITGGNQGSRFINDLVKSSLSDLTARWIVIHQCGRASQTYNPKQELEQAALGLSALFKSRYFIREWVSDEEVAWILSHARGALTRSGANTVDELALFKVPAIFIPLPNSHFGEQISNAQEAIDQQGGIMLPQDQATPEKLKIALSELTQSFPSDLTSPEERQKNELYHSPSRLLEVLTQILAQRAT